MDISNLTPHQLIRQGNQAFNEKDYFKAGELFERAKYKSGLIQVAEHFYNNQKPLIAYGFYQKAGEKFMIEHLQNLFVGTLRIWLESENDNISPILKP